MRFSHPGIGTFVKSPDDAAELERFLYEPERLERRMHLFEKIALPSLLSQTDPDFIMIFLIGENLPTEYRNRLERAVSRLAHPVVFAAGAKHSYLAVREALQSVPSDDFSHRTTFRIDDDDALCMHYIERLKFRARMQFRPDRPRSRFAIAYNRGFYLSISPDGNEVYDVVERHPLGLGLSLTALSRYPHNIYKHHHRRVAMSHDLFMDSTYFTFVRTVHRDNDSGAKLNGLRDQIPQEEVRKILKRDFAFDHDALMAV